ncbi:Bug family tripartite tricarboxylate transporter substrate binding protein [Rhodoplanes sp. Z2-YC6860]|uniref:Bug family tripartite tricarboxylate transporter substrate binding protein n=1 Tax=Rhodoplanes sp. Z2-YC6860 TaxID=674703 RepID=UPI00078DC42D|nr:tripartite tricarboxylate transporter substrate binding protein [Rhodoplanes sp. Z2-YC6860]AMN40093.1 extra-cytoplasmic solute receptor [Rhodoplanes sp. Z2-YC6860]
MGATRWIFALTALVVAVSPAAAQQFPTKPITFVVPYAAGGNVDISTRILQAGIGETLGQPIIVENRPGAGGLIAGDYVARSAPDGSTLFVGSNASILLGPMTMPKPPYRWDQAFEPVSGLAVATNMLLVTPNLPVKTVGELIDYAKKNPGKLTLATSSGASINHFMAELLKLKTGITWTEVHYRGNAPAINDLMAGHVDVGFMQLTDSRQYLESGKLRALAVLGPKRAPAVPDVPTIIEAGLPDVQGITFNGLFAPKGTPPAVVDKLSTAIRTALSKKEVIDRLGQLGSDANGSTPAEFTKFLNDETAKWTDVMQKANIKVTGE